MLNIILVGVLIGLLYGIISLGAAVSFRVLAFPDLTLEGGVPFSAAICYLLLSHGASWLVALMGAFIAGAVAGIITALIHSIVKIGPLLSGLISSAILYSAFFHVTRGRANVSVPDSTLTLFDLFGDRSTEKSALLICAIVLIVGGAVILFFRTRAGHLLRTLGERPRFVEQLGYSVSLLRMLGLAIANALIGVGAGLLVQFRRVADVSIVGGLLISSLATIMLGESILRAKHTGRYVVSIFLGSILYSTLVSLALYNWSGTQGWTFATDVRALAGIFIMASAWLGGRRRGPQLFSSEW